MKPVQSLKSKVQRPRTEKDFRLWTLDFGPAVLAVAEGFEPSHGRINSAVPYQLGYATEEG